MIQLKKIFSDCEFGELKNSVIKGIAVIGVIDNSLRERILRGQNLTLRKAIALGLSAKQMKIYVQELKQEAGIYRIKFNKKENRYSEPPPPSPLPSRTHTQNKIKQCKYCGRTHMRGSGRSFHQTCNNCHKKGHFANVFMSTNKSLNSLDKFINNSRRCFRRTKFLHWRHFWYFQWRQKQQPTNRQNLRAGKRRVAIHTRYGRNQHLLQNWFWVWS